MHLTIFMQARPSVKKNVRSATRTAPNISSNLGAARASNRISRICGEPSENGLMELRCQGMAAVAAGFGLSESLPGELKQAESVEFPEREQPGIGGEPGAVQFRLQAAIDSKPKTGFCRFTRWASPRISKLP